MGSGNNLMSNIYFGEQKNKSLADLRKSDRSRWVAPGAIPNMAGHVLTVRGPLSPDQLGMTLMHEHLFVDLRKTHLPHAINVELEGRTEPILTTEDFPATQLAVYEAKVQLGNLHIARDMGPIADNYVLADEDVAAGVGVIGWIDDAALAHEQVGGIFGHELRILSVVKVFRVAE